MHIFGQSAPDILTGTTPSSPSRPPKCKQPLVMRHACSSDCSENPFINRHRCSLLASQIFCQYQNILVQNISFFAVPKKPSDWSEHENTQ